MNVPGRASPKAGDAIGAAEPPLRHTREAFSGWPMIVGWLAILIFAFHACTHMVAAGDTWVAMACGRHFVNHGVDTVEPFSINSHKPGPTPEEVQTWPRWAQWITGKVGLQTVQRWHPTGWINQNWLTHVMFYWLTTRLGSESEPYYDALVLWKFAIYGLAAIALYFTCRLYGVNPAIATVFVCFALFIGRSFFDIRPAGFSNLLVAVLLLVLALASYKNALYIWLIVPLIVFWANVHGGYIYAFIVLVPFVGWHSIMRLPRRWAIVAYSVVVWLVLCALANRILRQEHFVPVAIWKDWPLHLVLASIAGGVALARSRKVSDHSVIVYHAVLSCVLFSFLLLIRFYPDMPPTLSAPELDSLRMDVASSRLAYVGIFSLMMIVGAIVVSLKEKVLVVMDVRGIIHVAAAGMVALVMMVIFNPFHLTNVTHTFVISISKHAERWRDIYEWHRAFDWSNPVGTAMPFLFMFILAWLTLLVWAVVSVRISRAIDILASDRNKDRSRVCLDYKWPKIDMALLLIAAMTMYMAVRSRRFIPITAFAACPFIGLLIDQTVRTVAATIQFHRTGRFMVPPVPTLFRYIVTAAGVLAVVVLGFQWGLKFKSVYLDYWPADAKLKSVFMRMTASDAKPFTACEFIRKNKLTGNMFNYWTEGGFLAWAQEPDPTSGRIPAQLFMDGRAQAAYDVSAFDRWSEIMSGGPTVGQAAANNGELTTKHFIRIGKWISEQFKKHDVWIVLIPRDQFDKPFTYGLECSDDWRTIYIDGKQKLFVNVASPRGAELFQGMFTGKVIYPDEYLANLAIAHNLLMSTDRIQRRRAFELMTKVLDMGPASTPMLETMLIAAQFPELDRRINDACREYIRDFEENKEKYRGINGCNVRLEAAQLALVRLEREARTNGDMKLAKTLSTQMEQYKAQQDEIMRTKRW